MVHLEILIIQQKYTISTKLYGHEYVRLNNQQCRKALFIRIILQLNSIKISQ
jgi:hypothetical protein